MSSISSICTVIKHEFKEIENKLALLSLSNKKQCEYIEMLYYILEKDTPLFFELFGGQVLKIPTKNEFLKAENNIRLFLYTIAHADRTNPFIHTSYKFGICMDRVYANFIDNYEIFVMNKPENEIEFDITLEGLHRLEDMYILSKTELEKIKKDSSLNKKYGKATNKKVIDEKTNSTQQSDNESVLLEADFDYSFDKEDDLSIDNYEELNSKQLSLF